jgi:hypothetical protein
LLSSSILYALLCVQRGGGTTAWETCRSILRTVPTGSDVIATTSAGSYLARMLREEIEREHLFLHDASQAFEPDSIRLISQQDDSGLPLTLGDRDLEIVASLPIWPGWSSQTAQRMRTIDSLYGTHNPGLLVVEDARSAVPILDGARETLRRHRPAVLISLSNSALAERSTVWEACVACLEPLGYVWVDGLMLPRTTREQRSEAVTACANDVICALPSSAAEIDLPSELLPLPAYDGDPIAAIAWKDWAMQVGFDPQRTMRFDLPFDDRIAAFGLHPAEHDGAGICWRWSGPTAHVRLALPLPCAGHWRVRLQVFDWGVAGDARDLQVFMQGKPAPCNEYGDRFGWFGPIAVPRMAAGGVLNVDIVTPAARRASDEDPRRIGVNFTRCLLERTA